MRLATIAMVLASAAALALPAHAGEEPAPAAGLEGAVAAFDEGRLDDCVKACDAVPADDAEHAKALWLRAEALLLLGRADDAAEGFRGVLAERPRSVPARTGLGRALTALGALDEAEDVLRDAVKRDKKSAPAHRALGELLIARQKYSDARGVLSKAWKLDPTSPSTAIPLVDVHLGYDDTKGALKVARQLAKERPESPVGHFLVGRVLEHEREWKDAIDAYQKAVAADDTYLDAHRNLAILCHTQNPMYRDRELLDTSMKHYERYFELGGDEPELRRIYDQMSAFLKSLR